ncbi:MAG: hypothetical protein R6U91_02350 [Bacillota bacterium]
MLNLIIGFVLIGIFFVLVFMLKRGYEEKERYNQEKTETKDQKNPAPKKKK